MLYDRDGAEIRLALFGSEREKLTRVRALRLGAFGNEQARHRAQINIHKRGGKLPFWGVHFVEANNGFGEQED
jgi:hypothetical protein